MSLPIGKSPEDMAKKIVMYQCKCKKTFETEEGADACCRVPTPLPKPPVEDLRDLALKHIKDLSLGHNRSTNIEHSAYVALMETFYGPDVWVWINSR